MSCLVDHILHIIGIGEFDALSGTGILVLGLVQDDGTTVGDLVFGYELVDICDVAIASVSAEVAYVTGFPNCPLTCR